MRVFANLYDGMRACSSFWMMLCGEGSVATFPNHGRMHRFLKSVKWVLDACLWCRHTSHCCLRACERDCVPPSYAAIHKDPSLAGVFDIHVCECVGLIGLWAAACKPYRLLSGITSTALIRQRSKIRPIRSMPKSPIQCWNRCSCLLLCVCSQWVHARVYAKTISSNLGLANILFINQWISDIESDAYLRKVLEHWFYGDFGVTGRMLNLKRPVKWVRQCVALRAITRVYAEQFRVFGVYLLVKRHDFTHVGVHVATGVDDFGDASGFLLVVQIR